VSCASARPFPPRSSGGSIGCALSLGIIGLGRIGAAMARVAAAFEMEVLAWSPNLTEEHAAQAGARLVAKDALLAAADIVTLHLVLGERSRGVIGRDELARMKTTAWLVNTSRGPLIEEAALLEALAAGRIAGAALDVYDIEPMPPAHPLRQLPNVVLTPHIGYVTEAAYRAFFADTVRAVANWLDHAD
jgi:phosphoglycerate dehydrogenase-like enzyme